MRIIAGKAKGTKLKTSAGLNVRPTADRVKESVFNILQNYLEDAVVLDIFAGTGNLGLEALSRGAKSAVFLDVSSVSIAVIKENVVRSKMTDYMEVYRTDSLCGLEKLADRGCSFDLIFCDPPYNQGFVDKVLEKVNNTMLLALDGILVLEHSRKEKYINVFEKITLKRAETYGDTIISFFVMNKKEVLEV